MVDFLTSGPVVALCLEGKNAITIVRKMNGATNPSDALQGTIRGDFGLETRQNLVHSSDSQESAIRELELWFTKEELWTCAKLSSVN